MSLSTSLNERTEDTAAPHQQSRRKLAGPLFYSGAAGAAALFLYGGWERRWIADDGLIVLRTVRNLLAGNGPVFNAGERVETNTSAAWTYVVWFFSWLSQIRLEYVVLTIALVLSVLAIVWAMLGARRLWGAENYLLPAGALVYIALPPARDYATSGLENCLVIAWLGLLWLLLMRWSQAAAVKIPALLALGFVAGLAPLIRPEMTVVGAVVLLVLVVAPVPGRGWLTRLGLAAAAGLLPVGYQIWRMGYYGLPYPNTAVAKDAGGAKWEQGSVYLWNLVGPYWLWLPLVLLLPVALVLAGWRFERGTGWRQRLRSPAAVVAVFLLCAVLLTLFTLRVGGDFMHGRMLLPQLFCFLLPVAVLPVRVPGRKLANILAPPVWLAVVVWSFIIVGAGSIGTTTIGKSGIVDERAYYAMYTGHAHPIRAEDYLDFPRMRAMVAEINRHPNGGLFLPSAAYMHWFLVPPPKPIPPGGAGHSVYFLNLGMTSMNVNLDVRVLDQMGLSYPIAAHSDRLADGRIGHDKSLYPDWVVADLGLVDRHPWLLLFMDEDWVARAREALKCPATQDRIASYRAPLTFHRWQSNLRQALGFAKYRIDRVPKYEIQRCNLPDPIPPTGN